MPRESSNSGTSGGVSLALINFVLVIVAVSMEGKLDGATTCQYNMTVMAIVFAVLYGIGGFCGCCIAAVVWASGPVGKLCALLVVVATMVGIGVAGLVITHSAACGDYDGEFLWIMIVVNGSMTVAFAGIAVLVVMFPVCVLMISESTKPSTAARATAPVAVVPMAAAAALESVGAV
jgi:hypothetical protein